MKKRIVISFLANCFRGGSTLLAGIFLARFLGSEDYGTLVFLMASSMAIKQFLDLGSSSAFFTFLSQEGRSIKFIAQFWVFFFSKYLIAFLVIFLIMPNSWLSKIWLGNSSSIVVIALMAVAFQSDFWVIASQLLESQRKTFRVQALFVIAQLIHFGVIFELNYLGILTVTNYLLCIGLLWLVAGIIAVMSYAPVESRKSGFGNTVSAVDYINYCLPIAPIIASSFAGEYLDKWMLQNWGGAEQQAYFSVSAQISSASLLFTASFIKIFWKEVAETIHTDRIQSAIKLYFGARNGIVFISTVMAGACIPWASQIVNLLYGNDYLLAGIPLVFLMLYSIHQSMGQIDSVFLLASSKTKVGLKMNLFLMPVGVLISFILLAKSDIFEWGFGMGATGLAIKMFLTQLISVNGMAYLIQKEFGIQFKHFNQLRAIVTLLIVGMLIKIALITFLPFENYLYVAGITLYLATIIFLAIFAPKILSLPMNWMQLIKIHVAVKVK